MPIDFSALTPYTIDYDRLMKTLETHPMFTNTTLQKNYLNNWKHQLIKADNSLLKNTRKTNTLNFFTKNFQIQENFQQSVIYDNDITVFINFIVEPLVHLTKNMQQYAKNIHLSYFEPSRNFITWNPPASLPNNTPINDTAIILVHFYNARAFTYLVIDGNHRIHQAITHGKSSIKALVINPMAMLNDNFFQSKFDKLYFIFQNELYYLYHCKKQYQMTDKELLARSYLTSQQFNFLDVLPELNLF